MDYKNSSILKANKDIIKVGNNDYVRKILIQPQIGNYNVESVTDFIGYYILNNFLYVTFNTLKMAYLHNHDLSNVISRINYKIGIMYLNISDYLKADYRGIIDIKFTLNENCDKDNPDIMAIRMASGLSAMDVTNIFDTKDITAVSSDTAQRLVTVGMSDKLSEYIEKIYNKIMKDKRMTWTISSFYHKYIFKDYYNPFKRISKPYIIDAEYIKENAEEIMKYCKSKGNKDDLKSAINGKSFWEEMVIKASAIAWYNSEKTSKSAEHGEIYNEICTLFKTAGADNVTSELIAGIIKACTANRYRVLFVKDIDKVVGKENMEHWNKILVTCSKLFATSIYQITTV